MNTGVDDLSAIKRLLNAQPSADDVKTIAKRACAITMESLRAAATRRPAALPELARRLLDSLDMSEAFSNMIRDGLSPLDRLAEEHSPLNLEDEDTQEVLMSALKMAALTRPEWILPFGFDEVRYGYDWIADPTISEDADSLAEEKAAWTQERLTMAGIPRDLTELFVFSELATFKSTHYRGRDGVWHDFIGMWDILVPDQPEHDEHSFKGWFEAFKKHWIGKFGSADRGMTESVTLPALWVPDNACGDTRVHIATRAILRELAAGKREIASLHWRTLEEIVAELLREMGLKVVVTPRSKDGGRDVIARGELIPGEPATLAVEVKHRSKVFVSDLRDALWANRHFPALLFATSGRFSAGVYRERLHKDTSLRLFLKDGVALGQWIDQYFSGMSP